MQPTLNPTAFTKSKDATSGFASAAAGGAVGGIFTFLVMYYFFVYAPAQRKLATDAAAAATPSSGVDMEAQDTGTTDNPIHS